MEEEGDELIDNAHFSKFLKLLAKSKRFKEKLILL
jgi:hypothetical protein